MNKLTKMAALAVSAAMVSHAAHAGGTVNDLYLGFTASSATSDLILDLGQEFSLLTQATTDLSSDLGGLTSFNTVFSSSANGVSMAVLGGDSTSPNDAVYATQVRSGGAGDATVAGSTLTALHSTSVLSSSAAVILGLASAVGLPTAGNSVVDGNKTYSATEIQANAGTFANKSGITPNGALSSGVVYEDLWGATQTGFSTTTPYGYLGYFTFNYGNDSLTFTANPADVTAVPEPAAYGVLAGAGLLVLSLGRQLRRKTA